MMPCPSCRVPTVVLELRGVEVDYCLSCRGLWLDTGELDVLLGAELGTPPTQWLETGKLGKRLCPHCSRSLRLAHFPGTTVELDVCANGHGVWIDPGELESLLGSGAHGIEIETLSGYTRDLLGKNAARAAEEGV